MAFHGLLVSSGFSSAAIQKRVSGIVSDRGYTKACIVTTARPEKERASWNIVTKEQLESMGLEVSFIDFDAGESLGDDTDLVYVCGGNTFHLLHSIQKAAADIRGQIERMCGRGGLYIGSSAGAVIVSPDIASAGEVHPDKNYDSITDVRGLNFVPFHIIPHYTPSMDSEIQTFAKRHGLSKDEVLPLRNGEALYIDGDEKTVISS